MPDTYRNTQIAQDAEYRAKVDALMKAIYGNGQPGLIDDMAEVKSKQKSFYDRWIQREEDKKTYDDRSSTRQMILIALATLILGLLAFFGIQARLSHTAFVSHVDNAVTAQNGSQSAGADLEEK